MRVVIYRTNEDVVFGHDSREDAKKRFPDARIIDRHPKYFSESDMVNVDVVYVRPGLISVRNAYAKAGIQVITGFIAQDMDIETEEVQDEPEEPTPIRLRRMSVKRLEGALSRIGDVDVIKRARDKDKRKSALKIYDQAITALGG